jgi:lactoylglutathione lyase
VNAQSEQAAIDIHAQARHDSPMGLVLHVADIDAASRFYQSIGFQQTAAYPGANGQTTVAFLVQGTSTLILGRRDQLHYENAERAGQVRHGPPGLGVVITLLVGDLQRVYQTVRAAGLPIQMEPADEFYGDRVFMFLDPDGYEWKVSQTIAHVPEQAVAAIIAAH